MRRVGRLCLLVFGALLLATASARAAGVPIVLDSSSQADTPGVAVEPNGTAHIAWRVNVPSGPDVIKYCQLPRGASACAKTASFTPNADDSFDSVDVLVDQAGHILILTDRCCTSSKTRTFMIESDDSGATWKAPANGRQIGDIASGHTIVGPGQHSVTGVQAGSYGTRVEVMPTDTGEASTSALLQPDLANEPSVALIDTSTPVAAWLRGGDSYYSIYDSTHGTAYNTGSNWKAPHEVPGEDLPQLVSSPTAGTFLMTHTSFGAGYNNGFQVRRINPSDGSPGAPVVATDIGDTIRAQLSADGGGGLTAVWTTTGSGAVKASLAPNGQAFGGSGTLVASASPSQLVAAEAPDHGGVVAYRDSDHGVTVVAIPAGGVVADPPPPTPPTPPGSAPVIPPGTTAPTPLSNQDTGGCTRQLTIRTGVLAFVKGDCFTRAAKGSTTWTATSEVDVNGIVFDPGSSGKKVTLDTAKHTLDTVAGVTAKAGAVVLGTKAVTWDLDGTTTFDLTGSKVPVLDFPATGEAGVSFVPGRANITVNLVLPAPFDSVTGKTTLTTTSAGGLMSDGIEITATDVHIGPFTVKDLHVKYSSGLSRFDGSAVITFPPDDGELKLAIRFEHGSLTYFAGALSGAPLFPLPVTAGLFLDGISVKYSTENGFTIGGGAAFGIPEGSGPILVDAQQPANGFTFTIPKGKSYAELSLDATLTLFGYQLSHSHAHFQTTGEFDFDSTLAIGEPGVLGIDGQIAGGINLPTADFFVDANLRACVIFCTGTETYVSNIGVAACVKVKLVVTLELMVGYKWGDGIDAGFSCDLGPYKPAFFGGSAPSGTPAAPALPTLKDGQTLHVPSLVPGQDPTHIGVNVPGNGGVPGVQVNQVNADGSLTPIVASDPADPAKPVQGKDVLLFPSPGTESTRLVLLQNSLTDEISGDIRITQAGGAPLASRAAPFAPNDLRAHAAATVSAIQVAMPIPATTVTAKIGGKGRKRTLAFKIAHLAGSGRTVKFVEVGRGGIEKPLGTTRARAGVLRWTIFDGDAGRRQIKAYVTNADGLPLTAETVATYVAPAHLRPGRVTHVKLERDAKGRLKITWHGPTNSVDTYVRVVVHDGRKLGIDTRKHSTTVPGVSKREHVQVSIQGMVKSGLRGPTAHARR